MPFIGNKPTAVPLTSSDLEDNIISTAKIQDDAVTTAKTSYSDAPFRNIIINGDMSIAQRSTSVASITATGYYTVDRFRIYLETLGTWTMSQSTDVPSGQGFASSTKLDCTTADASPSAGDLMAFAQMFEGQNLQYLKKGTANAVSLTASFWVKSTKTGTFILELKDEDNTRSISKSYTVNTTNTWEKKTITYEGDTTGAFTNDNGASLNAIFWLGAGTNYTSGTLATSWESNTNANRAVGQVNIADSTSNDFYITGVQLEAGTTASDFEFLPYDVNEQRCFRYFQKVSDTGADYLEWLVLSGRYSDAHGLRASIFTYPDGSMRASPSYSYDDGSGNSIKVTIKQQGGTETANINLIPFQIDNKKIRFNTYNVTTGLAAQGDVGSAFFFNFELNAEL
jgi:hypothetical protein